MTSPGRAHLLAFDAPNLLISSYPLVMVPTFAVPLALMLHGLVLWRLRRGATATGRLATASLSYRLTKCEGGQVSPSILDHTCSLHLARHNNILSSTHVSVGSKADFDMPRMDVR